MSNTRETDIRVITSADITAFRQLRLDRLLESPAAFGTSYEEEIAKSLTDLVAQLEVRAGNGNFVMGAFTDDHLVGMAGLSRQHRLKFQHKADLWGMFVRPEWRQQGIGGDLLDALINRSRGISGLRQIVLTVNSSNLAACSLYKSRGFSTFGIEPDALFWQGDYFDLQYMQMKLT